MDAYSLIFADQNLLFSVDNNKEGHMGVGWKAGEVDGTKNKCAVCVLICVRDCIYIYVCIYVCMYVLILTTVISRV